MRKNQRREEEKKKQPRPQQEVKIGSEGRRKKKGGGKDLGNELCEYVVCPCIHAEDWCRRSHSSLLILYTVSSVYQMLDDWV